MKILRDEEWHQENSLILKEGKIYVSRDEKLRAEVIRLPYRRTWKTIENDKVGDKKLLVTRGH